MHLLWFTILLSYIRVTYTHDMPEVEKHYNPLHGTTAMTTYINGTDTEIASTYKTPDYRIEEKVMVPYTFFFKERERPYRLSPHYKQTLNYDTIEKAFHLGCYCCTVYRQFILLAGCAVLTTRHILTTATPTELVLRTYGRRKTMQGILGGWYDIDSNTWNSSVYMTPARIHFHPLYKYDYEMNASHPIPCLYDLSVWAATYNLYGSQFSFSGAVLCARAVSSWFHYSSSILGQWDLSMVVGFQFMKAFKRRPLPWYKYGVKTKSYVFPCPKSDWHWYHCVMGDLWGKYGFDSGGALHFINEGKSNRIDGFIGMCAFSLKLRSMQITHYFTVIDTYPVLDFMYDAYLGLQEYRWLDARFQNTKWAAPIPWWGEWIDTSYSFGYEYKRSPLAYW